MESLLVMAMLGGAFFSQAATSPATTEPAPPLPAPSVRTDNPPASGPASGSSGTSVNRAAANPANATSDIPPLPKGRSTILGGAIRDIDPVRDRFLLNVYGEKPMKILFDERTQVFRDGKKIPLHELTPAAHASVQTTLDGATIFALSVHILSEQPAGNYEGRVMSFNPATGLLTVTSADTQRPFQVRITGQTSFKRLGQAAFSSAPSSANDLMPGSLVQIKFASDNRGQGTAQQVSVLAAPGATFIFSGTLTALDVPAGALTVVDPRTNQSYRIFFDPSRQPASQLRAGQHVRISANYDGNHYSATEITIQ